MILLVIPFELFVQYFVFLAPNRDLPYFEQILISPGMLTSKIISFLGFLNALLTSLTRLDLLFLNGFFDDLPTFVRPS